MFPDKNWWMTHKKIHVLNWSKFSFGEASSLKLLQKYEFRVFFMIFEFFLKLLLNLAFAPSGP